MKIVKFKYKSCLRMDEEKSSLTAPYSIDYCFKYSLSGEFRKSTFQEAILGRTPSDGRQKDGFPVEKLTGCVIWIEEFKR